MTVHVGTTHGEAEFPRRSETVGLLADSGCIRFITDDAPSTDTSSRPSPACNDSDSDSPPDLPYTPK